MERVEFFDRHTSTELTSLLSIELDSLRSFIFSNVSRDRGLRAILEASGAVLVRIIRIVSLRGFLTHGDEKVKIGQAGGLP